MTVMCRALKLSRAPYYRRLDIPITNAELVEVHRANALFDAHVDDPEFGYRLLGDEAAFEHGEPAAERTAWKIASGNSWWSTFGKKHCGKGGQRPGPALHDDLVERDFTATRPNQLWLVNITEHKTGEGKLYRCSFKDAFCGRIMEYSISGRMKACLAVDAINNGVKMRGDVAGCVAHGGRGSQFRAKKFRRALREHGLVGSMGRVGAAGDNAAMASFFSLLQKNVLDWRQWATGEDLRIAIMRWNERTYHRRRRQAGIGKLTPIEFEALINPPLALAA